MEYRRLGATGLKVSAISYGNWVNSDDKDTQDRNTKIIQKAWELGINFFDTAEIYGDGKAEIHLGHALKTLNVQRQDIVTLSKKHIIQFLDQKTMTDQEILIIITFTIQVPKFSEVMEMIFQIPNIYLGNISQKYLGLRKSLKRLDTPYVDIVFAHRYDYQTPLEETCRAFDWIIRHGLAHYWGTSEWTAQQIHQAIGICDRLSLHKPVVEQPQYNMMVRDRFEWEYESVFASGYGSTIWSPLYQGLLTGKYNDDILADGRFKNSDNVYVKHFYQQILGDPEKRTKIQNQLKQLGEVAKELGVTQAQLSLAWALKNKDVSTAITSATRPEQLEETVKSVQVVKLITKEVEQKIETILSNKPTTSLNFKQMAPYPTRRDLYV